MGGVVTGSLSADFGPWSMSASKHLSSAPSHVSQFLARWSKIIDFSQSVRLSKEIRFFHPVLAVHFNCFVMVEHSIGSCFVTLWFKITFSIEKLKVGFEYLNCMANKLGSTVNRSLSTSLFDL